MVDILEAFNSLKTGLQGTDEDLFKPSDKFVAILKNVSTGSFMLTRDVWMFPNLAEFLKKSEKDSDVRITPSMQSSVTSHLGLLITNFEKYFPTISIESIEWVHNHFKSILKKLV